MRVRLFATTTRTLLLFCRGGSDNDLCLGSSRHLVGQKHLAQLLWIVGDLDRMPRLCKYRVHGQHERRVIGPDCLWNAVLGSSHQHLVLLLHLGNVFGHIGPAVLQVLDLQAQGRLLCLEMTLELGAVMNVQFALVFVSLVLHAKIQVSINRRHYVRMHYEPASPMKSGCLDCRHALAGAAAGAGCGQAEC